MNLAMAGQFISWGIKAAKAIWDVVQAAMKASDTVSLNELKENAKKMLDESHEDWVKEITEESAAKLIEEAKKAYDAAATKP
jgi:hypothetical protein